MATTTKTLPDWERIELDYRAGVKSLREIAVGAGVSRPGIQKHADKHGWTRDLNAKIKAAADAKVARAAVATPVATVLTPTETAIVEANAEAILRVRLTHRSDIARGRTLAMSLLGELEHQTDSSDLYEQLADLVLPPSDPNDTAAEQERARKRREAFDRVMSTAGRQDTLKKWAETVRILIDKEREAFGILNGPPPDASYEQTLREAMEQARAAGL